MIAAVPIMRKDLQQMTDRIEKDNPGIKFDYSVMDSMQRKNLWFIDVMQNVDLKTNLLNQILAEGEEDTDDLNTIINVMSNKSKEGWSIEGNYGLYLRV